LKKITPVKRVPSSVKSKSKLKLPKPLKAATAFKACPVTNFKFRTTKDINTSYDFISQDRAVSAINMGLGIRKPGYNIYVAGYQGTGKTSVIRTFLEKWSKKAETPNDWVYLHDFDKPESPIAMELPRGEAKRLKKKMAHFIRDLRYELPKALQSEEYENSVSTYLSSSNERKSKLYSELEKLSKSLDFTIKSRRMGIETVPIINGRPISEKEYAKLEDGQRDIIETNRAKLEPEVLDFARKVRTIDSETRDYIETLRNDLGLSVINSILDPVIDEYVEKDLQDLVSHLEKIKEHTLENLLEFVEFDDEEMEEEAAEANPYIEKDPSKNYQVNIFVDNSKVAGAPVVIETNPSFYNLFGKIEKNVEFGVYQTDFTMIKAGAIQRANGGYLVLNANDIFRHSSTNVWETLKRVLRNREAFIEDIGEQFAVLPTSGLRPQPVPLDLKVILIGNDEIYHILLEEDEEFRKIFKIKADFDYKMPRSKKNIDAYASFVATRAKMEKLLPFDRSAIAAIVEFSSRTVEDQNQLSTQFGEIKDLSIEADYVANAENSKLIKRAHVESALDEKFYRLNLIEQHLIDMVKSEDILLSVDGERVGQVNGLTVYDIGDYSFGRIGRITCTTSISDDGITNIERACRLSGNSHDKGMLIITGFLNGVLAKEHSMGISASVCFEQSYGMIDGDSASTAELIAIISSLAEIPIKQNFAITGSINQMGEIQSIGGVNEKLEGFYKTCRMIGKGKQFNVIIPIHNVDNLMLHREVVEAVKSGYFNILPCRYLWEAFELITGVPLGVKDVHTKTFTPGSALDKIKLKLDRIYNEEHKSEKDAHEKEHPKTKKVPKGKKVARSLRKTVITKA